MGAHCSAVLTAGHVCCTTCVPSVLQTRPATPTHLQRVTRSRSQPATAPRRFARVAHECGARRDHGSARVQSAAAADVTELQPITTMATAAVQPGGAAGGAAQRPISQRALAKNVKSVTFVRTSTSILSGMVVGVLGLTNTMGFVGFAVLYALSSLMLGQLRMGGNTGEFLIPTAPWYSPAFLLDSIGGNLITFLLFWTLSFALVHLY